MIFLQIKERYDILYVSLVRTGTNVRLANNESYPDLSLCPKRINALVTLSACFITTFTMASMGKINTSSNLV